MLISILCKTNTSNKESKTIFVFMTQCSFKFSDMHRSKSSFITFTLAKNIDCTCFELPDATKINASILGPATQPQIEAILSQYVYTNGDKGVASAIAFLSMGSALFLLFFIIIELAATRVQTNCRSVSSINEYALTGHTYKTITGNHLTTCVALCDDDPRCYSINYKFTTRTCELSDSTRVTTPKDFIHKPSHVYLEHLYRPLGSCYENAPCQNSGTCVNIPHSPGYQCSCRKDYTGELCEVCTSPALGMSDHRIPDLKITASSAGFWFHGVLKPHLARLHGSSSWVAALLDLKPYLQISFSPRKMLITGVATQGNPEHDWWTTSYVLKYSFNERNWINYKKNGMVEVFLANTDRNTVMSHVLEKPLIAIFLRFDAITKVYRTSLRVEVYGCDA